MSKKLKKFALFVKKAKFRDVKMLNHSTTTKNNAVPYYKTVEEVCWHLGLKKFNTQILKITQIFKKFEKNCEK